MKIRWMEDAFDDLKSLREYIANDKPQAANQIAKRILSAVNHLGDHPYIGKAGRVNNTRELIITGTPFIVPYTVNNNVIEILRIFHAAMQWPDQL